MLLPNGSSIYVTEPKSIPGMADNFHGIYNLGIINRLAQPIYLVRDDGSRMRIPETSYGRSQSREAGVEIHICYRNGTSVRLPKDQRSGMYTPTYGQTILISADQLIEHPVYIPGIAVVVTTAQYLNDAKFYHPASKEYREYIRTTAVEAGTDTVGNLLPVNIYVNLTDCPSDYLYTTINNTIVAVEVSHHANTQEGIILDINTGKNIQHIVIDKDKIVYDKVITTQVNGTMWYMSFDRECISNELSKQRKKFAEVMTKTEVDYAIKTATKELCDLVAEKDREIERLKRELSGVKKDLSLTDADLTRANAVDERSFTQETLAMKRDSQRLAVEQEKIKANSEAHKAEVEKEITEAKARKEECSARTAEANTMSNTVKVGASLVPIIAAGLVWLFKSDKDKGGKSKVILNYLLGSLPSLVPRSVKTLVSMTTNIVNTISGVVNTVSNAISNVWDWIWS